MSHSLVPLSELEAFLAQSTVVQCLQSVCSKEGIKLYIFGGFLRDFLKTGKITNDIDFYVECDYQTVQRIRTLFREAYTEVSARQPADSNIINPAYVDIVHCDNVEEHIYRSDFTVNSILYDFQSKTLLAPTGGLDDLKAGILRINSLPFYLSSGNAFIRMFRQAAQLQFQIDEHTLAITKESAYMISLADPYRASKTVSELYRFFVGRGINPYVRQLIKTGILRYMFPETGPALKMQKPEKPGLTFFNYNLELFKHSDAMLDTLPDAVRGWFVKIHKLAHDMTQEFNRVDQVPNFNAFALVRLASLFNNIGQAFIEMDPNLPGTYKTEEYYDKTTEKLILNMASRFCYIEFVLQRLVDSSFVTIQANRLTDRLLAGQLDALNEKPIPQRDQNSQVAQTLNVADNSTEIKHSELYCHILFLVLLHLKTRETLGLITQDTQPLAQRVLQKLADEVLLLEKAQPVSASQ